MQSNKNIKNQKLQKLNVNNSVQVSKPNEQVNDNFNKTNFSMMSDYQVSVYDAINNSIHEYFIKKNYPQTLEVFQLETKTKLFGHQDGQRPISKLDDMLVINFERGEITKYFENWNQYIPLNVRYFDENAVRLEFYIQLYFLIYDIHPAFNKMQNKVKVKFNKQKLEVFKNYLENKGSQLSKDNEFLPFFAIPYIQNVMTHPIMTPFMKQEWPMVLKEKLSEFLQTLYNNGDVPILIEMYQSYMQKIQQQQNLMDQSQNNISPSISEMKTPIEKSSVFNIQQHNQDLVNAIQDLNTKYIELQKNYKSFADNAKSNLIESQNKWASLAKELVQISKDLMNNNIGNVNDVKSKIIKYEQFLNSNFDDLIAQSQDLSVFDKNSFQDGMSEINVTPNNKSQIMQINKVQEDIQLDYIKVISWFLNMQQDLEYQLKIGVLINCLRQRIIIQENNQQRKIVIQEYQQNDILGCYDKNQQIILNNLLFSESKVLRLQTLMFINTLCSDSQDIIKFLLIIGKQQTTDNKFMKNSLAALQKLSLRKKAQRAMLNGQILQWLFQILKNINQKPNDIETMQISEFTMEYSTALLMNLSLRQLGKQQCNNIKEQLLEVLMKLLFHENPQIRTFINGTLYSLFSYQQIRQYAKQQTDIYNKLQEILVQSEEQRFQRQIQYILEQLNNEENNENDDSMIDEQDDYDDQDDDEPFQEDDELENIEEISKEHQQEVSIFKQFEIEKVIQEFVKNQYMSQYGTRQQDNNEFIQNKQPDELISKPKIARTPIEMFRHKMDQSDVLDRSSQLTNNQSSTLQQNQSSTLQQNQSSTLQQNQSSPINDLQPHKVELRKQAQVSDEYKQGFISKPRLPRTPPTKNE